MKNFFTILLIAFFSVTGLYSQALTGQFTMTYNDRGIMSYIYFSVPSDYDSTKSYPFLLAWHGAGDTGNNMRTAVNIWLANKIGAILVCPDANNVNGHDGSYFSNLAAATYSDVRGQYNIDTTKMISMGFSWGGQFAYQLGLLNPQLFTGIIGLAPAIGSLDQTMWDNIKELRMATILGTNDINYSAVNSLMNQIISNGGALLYLIKQGVQHVDNTYFNSEEIKDDFFQCYNFVIGNTVKVQEINTENNDFVLSPNPASDFITLSLGSKSIVPVEIHIFNITGCEFYHNFNFNEIEGNLKINTQDFTPGIYYLTIKTSDGVFCRIFSKM